MAVAQYTDITVCIITPGGFIAKLDLDALPKEAHETLCTNESDSDLDTTLASFMCQATGCAVTVERKSFTTARPEAKP